MRLCKFVDDHGHKCTQKHSARGFCKAHYAFFRHKIIDVDGNRLRATQIHDPNRGCKVKGCTRKHKSLGFCNVHYGRYYIGALDVNGKQLREVQLLDPNRGCKVKGCTRKHATHGFCLKHFQDFWVLHALDANGNKLREVRRIDPNPNRKCKVQGCTGKYHAKGFCNQHWKLNHVSRFQCIVIEDNRRCSSHRIIAHKMCEKHAAQYFQGIRDVKGQVIREFRRRNPERGCKIEGCKRIHRSEGFCSSHRTQFKLGILNFDGTQRRRKCNSFESIMNNEDIFNRTFAKSCTTQMTHIHLN